MNILVIHNHIPKPDLNGAELRLVQILTGLVESGHQVTFLALFPCNDAIYVHSLQRVGIRTLAGDAHRLRFHGIKAPVEWDFDDILTLGEFDLAVLTLWFWHEITIPEHYSEAISQTSPNTAIAVLSDDRHGLRQKQLAAAQNSSLLYETSLDYWSREVSAYEQCDLILTIAEAERLAILNDVPNAKVLILPFACPIEKTLRSHGEREDVLCLANYTNPASVDSARWFMRDIWPGIAEEEVNIRVTFAGVNSETLIESATPRLRCVGHVKDLREIFLSHRLQLSPLRCGTGLCTRNIIAMSYGLPVVTTSIGAQGLGGTNRVDLLVGDTAKEFQESVRLIYSDARAWTNISEAGKSLVSRRFSRDRLLSAVHKIAMSSGIARPEIRSNMTWSCRLIDRLDRSPGFERGRIQSRLSRIRAHVALAESLCTEGAVDNAIRQLRHASSLCAMGGANPSTVTDILARLKQYYQMTDATDRALLPAARD